MADDEFALRRDMAAASVVQTFLENEIVSDTFAELKAIYIAAWETSAPRDTDGRERLHQRVQALGDVKKHLEMIAANGRLAEQQIERDLRPPKRFGII